MPFSPDYVRLVLNEIFEDAKTLLLDPMMALHEGHLVMLAEQGIVSREDARRLRGALAGIDLKAVRATAYPGSCEDLFFHVDGLIAAACGKDVAGRLHTARSRNDMAMTMYRMRLREYVLALADTVIGTRQSLLSLAERHVGTIYPAHTHTQPAQPTTVAHYLLAVIEELERHSARIFEAYRATNRNPLGACAITGTAFPIDRDRTSTLLGFDGPTGNTYGSIASIDYLLESASAAANTVVGLGRFVQDMLLWCTVEMGFLRLTDGFVQVSSIMPQKRNPVALEHARSLLSKALGGMQAIPSMAHNTPFGDINDTEDDLQPLVAGAFRDALRGIEIVAVSMADAEFDVARMRARASEHWVTLTELADTLARDHGLPFGTGHDVATRVIRASREQPDSSVADLIAAATLELAGREVRLTDADVARILSPEHFVEIRRTHGGPSRDVVSAALQASGSLLARDRATAGGLRAAIAASDAKRTAALKSL
ncbi:MAG TPA: argininosuccinate lyase [Vicinamibacterales bacterium]|nr:argininosuccinate lyase [Vicinamibacterales bacterium]